ncbi:MAG: hypothetical protein QGH25_10380, partial [Candidatus Latescibacteria bacterium]|nr:hypothetical protein [Candidatus Latescibacterota bacterium]
ARGIRTFAQGFIAVLLGVYLADLGLSLVRLGAFFSVGVAGSAVLAIVVGLVAEQVGRRRLLVMLTLLAGLSGIGLALTAPAAAGQTYFFADEKPYLWRDVFLAMARAQDIDARPRHLPGLIAPLCTALDRSLGALGLYHLMVHVAGEATRHMACSIDKARDELGYEPTVALDEGIQKAVDWARARGWL